MPNLFDNLNENQLRAVTSTAPVILCLAGAGSGKTTVLTRRVANLHLNYGVSADNMLCLTFTRLAGKEMKERVIQLIGEEEGTKLFCNTFHAFSVSVLKKWGHKLGIDENFTIYGDEDRQEIIEKIIQEFGGRTTLQKVLNRHEKGGDYRIEDAYYPEESRVLKEYGYRCKQNNAVDLNRLIDLVIRLWELHPDVLAEYRQTFSHVFVDEYQDTNDEQAYMIDLLQAPNLFVVGDDFQAIYGWRGAEVRFILQFADNNPHCEVIKLEDNYRSTESIIAAANSLIRHNINQTEKKLIAHKKGPDVYLSSLQSADQEAIFIARVVADKLNSEDGIPLKNIAILARTNNQIDKIQRILEQAQVPCLRIGGREDPFNSPAVRPLLQWMYFLYNKRDNIALKKCLKQFDIRPLQFSELEFKALADEISLWDALQTVRQDHSHSVFPFITAVEAVEQRIYAEVVTLPTECFDLLTDLLSVNFNSATVHAARHSIERWEESKQELGEDCSVQAFLKFLRYRDVQEKLIQEQDAVKLMTVHASKGLEFDTVIVAGLNQGVFPSKRGDIEEERRLFYVAVTRAKNRLILTCPERAPDWRGDLQPMSPSQFLDELGIREMGN
ncbi:ATP-dependent DNA helicase [uncultured Sporomusa sp.]|uniref:DNA 3'-5' helicase n=1 Tax=uncultured Sporomusa sp. TaxID=307249 RepID=A0A212LY69_9FIRM|nr:ATP-dependent helicase [uncultured Sporomusa sp.]SCM82387.1 ATP-dependent DNA helicase [uncultured Sporomusa sp.]